MTTSGPNSPGTMGTGAGGYANWSNTGNGAASDNAYATVSLSSGAGTTPSQELKATNFGFAISGTVDGIQVEIERKATADSGGRFGTDALVKLVKGGVTGGTNKADTTTHIPTSDTIASYGGAADLWGLTWLDSDINDSGFGVVVSYKNSATFPGKSSNTYSVDHIRITVYYTAGGAAGQPLAKRFGGVPFMGAHGSGLQAPVRQWIRRASGLLTPQFATTQIWRPAHGID